jgi:hypothetical protein
MNWEKNYSMNASVHPNDLWTDHLNFLKAAYEYSGFQVFLSLQADA